ncbi:MAG TPA: malonate decarboxylase holo-[acyl-carrier-protein] synthase [Noviherbaspirillum sp.]
MTARHDLIWLSGAGWDAAQRAATPAQQAALAQWRQAGWPATVRRRDADAGPDQVCLGLTLPIDDTGAARMRLGLRCLQSGVARQRRPLSLQEAAPALPQAWRTAYAGLERQAAAAGLDMRVYGSLALQALTGAPYLTARSDIDLAFYPRDAAQLDHGLALLDHYSRQLPLDGEIIFPSGQAVAWKEWRNAASAASGTRVLVKRIDCVLLAEPATLLDEFTERMCRA